MGALGKGFVTVPHGQVHFRYGGRGPLLVMLHDAARSSVQHVASIEWLGEYCTVVAVDAPGAGLSTPLPVGQREIADYARALAATLTALGIERCALYGCRAGAAIAQACAAEQPTRVALALLDGLQPAADEPVVRPAAGEWSGFEPSADGSHLAREWTRLLDDQRFVPGLPPSAATRLLREVPDVAELHECMTDRLMAGAHWLDASLAAKRHDAHAAATGLRVPAVVLDREGAPNALAWRTQLLDALREARLPATHWSPPPTRRPAGAGPWQRYVDLVHGPVRVRLWGDPGRDTPLLVLADVPGGSGEAAALAANLGVDRAVIAPDLPGLGESHPLPYPSLGSYVSALAEMLEALGAQTVDIAAAGLGTAFGVALAAHRPTHVRRLALDGVPMVRSRDRRRVAHRYCPTLAPDRSGAYLTHLWQQLRDVEINWPWFERAANAARVHDPDLDPVRLQADLVEVVKQLPSYGDAPRAALEASLRDILPGVTQPVLLLEAPPDVRYSGTGRAARRLGHARRMPRPATLAGRAGALRAFFD